MLDEYSFRNISLMEKAEDLKKREKNLKELLLREMGVDNSIFD